MANAFTLLPMSQEMSLEPGNRYEGFIVVANPAEATSDFEYVAKVVPYNITDEKYTVDFNTKGTATQIVDWIEIKDPKGKLAPNEVKEIHFVVSVPKDAPAGGQYAAITVASNNNEVSSGGIGIKNVFEMASIIYASVKGETVHDGKIVSNSVPGFSTVTPVTSSVMLTNSGNVHEKAVTTITIKNVFGGQVFPADDEDNQFVEYVMPASSRYLTRSLDRLSSLGIYEINQSVDYLGQTSSISQIVIVCPIWFIVLVLATLSVFVGVIVSIVKKHLRLKRSI